MKYIRFLNGKPIACYSKDIHDVIPEDTVEVSDEIWQELINNQDKKIWDGSKIIDDPDYIPPIPVPAPLTAEELYELLEAKGVLNANDRPRPKM